LPDLFSNMDTPRGHFHPPRRKNRSTTSAGLLKFSKVNTARPSCNLPLGSAKSTMFDIPMMRFTLPYTRIGSENFG
jgi:hypothetical protein